MKRKYRIIVSVILLALSVGLCVCGVLLFNMLPSVNTNGYTDPKDAMVSTGVFFSFFLALVGLGGSVGFLIWTFTD